MIDIRTGKELNDTYLHDADKVQITRRDFIGGGLAAASAFALAGSANATVRRGLGARLAANFGGGGGGVPTARDYVQDGLVAMWDGIENAGWGTHDENATTWKDLIGSEDISLGSLFSFSSDSLVHGSGVDSMTTVGEFSNIEWTEYVVRISSWTKGTYVQLGNTLKCSYITYWGIGVGFSYMDNVGRGYATQLFSNSTVSRKMSEYTNSIWLNGVETYPDRDADRGWGESNNKLNIGGITYKPTSRYEICAIRLYSRDLTSYDIAANYAVDKARFGIT